jgi:tetratricopeptide (TPR) repeat protein
MRLTVGLLSLVTGFLISAPHVGVADELESDAAWSELVKDGRSFIFGRVQGRFDGADYRSRKIRVRNEETNREYLVPTDQGLGYFETALPVGTYTVVSIEAVYFPPDRSMRLTRYRPVPQRYVLQAIAGLGLPTFPVYANQPVYLGTIRSGTGGDRLVYEGHALEIVDEYDEAIASLEVRHPALLDSLDRAGVEPKKYFFLKPIKELSPLELANANDPLEQARDYMEDGKYEQALSWLQTFMPTTDAQRAEMKLLIGEIYLSDKKYLEAIEQLGEVLLDDPENTRALRLLARSHAFGGEREDAVGLYRALTESHPEDAEASLHLGYEAALTSDKELAERAFDSAFKANFDYLLHDLSPYALALRVEDAVYEPPKIVDGAMKLPSTMRSRRSASSDGGLGMLLDHNGRIVAVHLAANTNAWAPSMMMAIIRARFTPARLNGIAIPCLIIMGANTDLDAAQ